MDDKLKEAIEAAIEFRVGRFHQNQALLNDIETLVDMHNRFDIAGYLTLNFDLKIGWEPNVKNILARKPFNNTPVFMLRE